MLILIILVHFNDYKTTLTSPCLTVSRAGWRKPGCRCYGGKEKNPRRCLQEQNGVGVWGAGVRRGTRVRGWQGGGGREGKMVRRAQEEEEEEEGKR